MLVERLSDAGRVGTVKHIDCEPDIDTDGKDTSRHRSAGAVRTEGITGDGPWFATGDERTLTEVLDDLARSCDYALVEGYSEADLPTVALGDATVSDPLTAASTADNVDVDAVVDALEETEPYETLASLVFARRIDRALFFSDLDSSVQEWTLPNLTTHIPDRASDTFGTLVEADDWLTLSTIADRTDQSKSTVLRHVNDLDDAGVLESDTSEKAKRVRVSFSGELLSIAQHVAVE